MSATQEMREMVRLKFAATINDEALTEDTPVDWEMRYVDIGNVNSGGEIEGMYTIAFANAPSRARRIARNGDVIVSTVRTYLQAIASIEDAPENLIVSTGFAVVRAVEGELLPRFAKYCLREKAFLAEIEMRSVGISYPAINASELGDICISKPSLENQQVIADYLDRETARIDTLIAAKERLLRLLAEKRQALITAAVTRGIAEGVAMKGSGVEWLGEVPGHWEVKRSRRLFDERNERSETGDEEMLTVSHITGVTPRSEKDVNMFEAESTEGYKLCEPGDLAINTLWAWMGAMGVSSHYGIVSPAYHVYKSTSEIHPAYVDAIVRLPLFAAEVTRYSKGVWSSRLRLYPDGFYQVYFPVPPLEEQKVIVAHIRSETQKLDAMREAAMKSISLLKERRAALITAAVTGQLSIPNQ